MSTRNRQTGQTIVEIAIVLAIMGLLLGGSLKGEALNTQAKIKRTIQDLDEVALAIRGYQNRYKYLPGDDPEQMRWTVNGVALPRSAGQGDGIVDGSYASQDDGDETRRLWLDLRLAGFVVGDTASINAGSAQPLNAAGGVIGVQTGGLGLTGSVICASSLSARIAQAIDSQLDDGNAATGAIRAVRETAALMPVLATAPNENYQDLPDHAYVMCYRSVIS